MLADSPEAAVRMVSAQASHSRHSVQEGHVQVEHDRIARQLVDELDRGQPVRRRRDHCQPSLHLDQLTQRHEEILIVVSEQDADPALRGHSVQERDS